MLKTQVVILAAGQGLRLGSLTNDCPKCLLPFDGEPLLARTLRQLRAAGFCSIRIVVGHMQDKIKTALSDFKDIIQFVYNKDYASDTNSLSLHLGLQDISSSVLIIEADVVFSDECWPIIREVSNTQESVWFTCGLFQSYQVGGIVKSDAKHKIIDMRLVQQFAAEYKDYSKNLGVVYLQGAELNHYKSILAATVKLSTKAYYMEHWIKNLAELAAREVNFLPNFAGSFNTAEEFAYCQHLFSSFSIAWVETKRLKHIEGFSPKRVAWLVQKIKNEQYWSKPLCVDKNHYLVMDGQHRMEAARQLGLDYVPCILFDYHAVKVKSLRHNYYVEQQTVIQRSLQGDIYPYKTVKHAFPIEIPRLTISLDDLMHLWVRNDFHGVKLLCM